MSDGEKLAAVFNLILKRVWKPQAKFPHSGHVRERRFNFLHDCQIKKKNLMLTY